MIVPKYKSKFLTISILNKQRSSNLARDDQVVLDYSRFETSTVKFLVDALYSCNCKKVPITELLKLLQIISKLGFPEVPGVKEEFPCSKKETEY